MTIVAGGGHRHEVLRSPRPSLAERVDECLDAFVGERSDDLLAVGPDLRPVLASVRELVRGGKRLRASFCYWGWAGGGGGPDDADAVRAAASLELFHAAALVHDDLMDRSDTRRGRPTMHRRFAARHRQASLTGDADTHGAAVAVLVGDLCLTWSDELLSRCGGRSARRRAVRDAYARMRTQVIAGQYLDVLEQARSSTSEPTTRTVLQFKSAKYTVEHPLQIGGALAGASQGLLGSYAGFGLPIGEAFQLRDDVLGVFGDPARTGKPAGDDLREGKKTLLVVLALDAADPAQRARLEAGLGDPDVDDAGLDDLRAVLEETGALARVEERIRTLHEEARQALEGADLDPSVAAELGALADAAVWRDA